ncbi:YoaK family protein [Microvirga antarctica]|uniref:YoaK family protein n=1 Tax=Microvirga antarctica TaxID=2819233 RepID=UPI001B30BF11|nr:YoaK family protein [Microvirga antarctica]
MIGYSKAHITLALMLAGLAGFVDGMGFIHLGGLFVSFMSGNSTRLGVSLAQGEWHDAARGVMIILLFVVGAAAGALVAHDGRPSRRPILLLTEGCLLGGAALANLLGVSAISVGAMVIAMGMENAIFQKKGEPGIGLTYMTGALVRVGHRLAAALRGGDGSGWGPSLGLWASLCFGALLGAHSYAAIGLDALWIPSAVAFALAIFVFRTDGREPQP